MSDSSTAITYINNEGYVKSENAMNVQKKYGYNVLKTILLSLRHTYQENTILKKTSFVENLAIIQIS